MGSQILSYTGVMRGRGTQVHLLGFCTLVWHLLRESKDREQSHGNFLESGVGKERIRGGQA